MNTFIRSWLIRRSRLGSMSHIECPAELSACRANVSLHGTCLCRTCSTGFKSGLGSLSAKAAAVAAVVASDVTQGAINSLPRVLFAHWLSRNRGPAAWLGGAGGRSCHVYSTTDHLASSNLPIVGTHLHKYGAILAAPI